MTRPTTTFSPGDVVLVPFMFTDMVGVKRRPAVVMSARTYHQSRPDVVLMAITSQVSPIPGDVVVQDWASAGLVKAGYVKAIVQTVTQEAIARKLGTLSSRDLARAQACLRGIFGF